MATFVTKDAREIYYKDWGTGGELTHEHHRYDSVQWSGVHTGAGPRISLGGRNRRHFKRNGRPLRSGSAWSVTGVSTSLTSVVCPRWMKSTRRPLIHQCSFCICTTGHC